jgi:gas vesicle protein
MGMNNTIKITTGFITGTVLGASLALLLAPEKGSKTRRLIGDQVKDVSKQLDRTYSKTKRRLGLNRRPKVNVAF